MSSIYLVRHARSVANAQGVLAGRTPQVFLDDEGEKQLAEIENYFTNIRVERIVHSPLVRVKQTVAGLIAQHPEASVHAVAAVEFWRAQIDEAAVLASHGDVIKSIIAHYVGIEFDDFQRIQVAPASITRIEFSETDAEVTPLNYSSRDEVGGGDSEQVDSRI